MTHVAHHACPPIRPVGGRRALVTGGTTGIGRAAVLPAPDGARVLVCGRDTRLLDHAPAAVRAAGEETLRAAVMPGRVHHLPTRFGRAAVPQRASMPRPQEGE